MKLYTGIDLHSNNHYVCLIDEQDQRIIEKRLPNNLQKTLSLLVPYRDHIESIAIESTYNWYWLVDGLMEAGFDVKLVNTAAVQQYSGLKHTDDKSDAFWLAHLLRLDILPTGYIYPKAERGIRDLLRKRQQLVQDRIRHVLRVKSQVARSAGKMLSGVAIRNGDFRASVYIDDLTVCRSINADMACIDALNVEIETLEGYLNQHCKLKKPYKLLTGIQGIGNILAMTIMLETGDIRRFPSVGQYASYCRCVNSARYSNGKKKGSNNKRNGNGYLAHAFVEAAYFASRFYEKPKAFLERKTKEVNRALATKALAHKLARASYYVMRDQQPYDEAKLFH